MRAFRIADRRFPIFDGTGARLIGGRWNSPGRPVIYAAETFAGAVLQVLIHANLGRVPKTHAFVEISIPDVIVIKMVTPQDLPGWDAEDPSISRAYGDQWLRGNRTAVLRVRSVVTGGREHNILLNPEHPEFRNATASLPLDIAWDRHLFRQRR
jgi:RES domain-containing protein